MIHFHHLACEAHSRLGNFAAASDCVSAAREAASEAHDAGAEVRALPARHSAHSLLTSAARQALCSVLAMHIALQQGQPVMDTSGGDLSEPLRLHCSLLSLLSLLNLGDYKQAAPRVEVLGAATASPAQASPAGLPAPALRALMQLVRPTIITLCCLRPHTARLVR